MNGFLLRKKYNNLGPDGTASAWLPFCTEVSRHRKVRTRYGFLLLKRLKTIKPVRVKEHLLYKVN